MNDNPGGAIETAYKGHRFRSRLEARWAVFFDALNIRWRYESEGYEKTVGGSVFRYLPDFYLPTTGTWVEVKGDMADHDAQRMYSFLRNTCPMPDFTDSALMEFQADRAIKPRRFVDSSCTGLLMLGDIPDPNDGIPCHRLIQHHLTFRVENAYFAPEKLSKIHSPAAYLAFHLTGDQDFMLDSGEIPQSPEKISPQNAAKLFRLQPLSIPTSGPTYTHAGLTAARSARFEFGENG